MLQSPEGHSTGTPALWSPPEKAGRTEVTSRLWSEDEKNVAREGGRLCPGQGKAQGKRKLVSSSPRRLKDGVHRVPWGLRGTVTREDGSHRVFSDVGRLRSLSKLQ